MKNFKGSWKKLKVQEPPATMSRHVMAFDQLAQEMVMFGGVDCRKGPSDWDHCRALNGTWVFKDNSWIRVKTGMAAPSARQRSAMVYDPKLQCCVLFGGQEIKDESSPVLNDTHLFQNGRWKAVKFWFKKPSPRFGHVMAYDESMQGTVLFGGASSVSEDSLSDTWLFDGRWTRVKTEGPPGRRYAAMAYDPELKGCVLQGGSNDDFGREMYRDTWLFRDGTWERLSELSLDDDRDDHDIIYDPRLNRLLLMTGKRGRGVLYRTEQGWERVPEIPDDVRFQCAPIVFDPRLNAPLLFGGETDHLQRNDTIILELLDANDDAD